MFFEVGTLKTTRLCASIIVAYATFYVVRINFSFALPYIIDEYMFTKTQIGLLLSFFSIIYGVGKFFSGILADILRPERLVIAGLLGSSIVNLLIPSFLSSTLNVLFFLMMFNAIFQSFGWPSCVGIINKKVEKKNIGTVWGLCNSAHAIGSCFIAIFSGYIFDKYHWFYIFYIPSLLSIIVSIYFILEFKTIKIETIAGESVKNESYSSTLFYRVIKNPIILCMSMGTLFLYIVRLSFLNWLPIYLIQFCHQSTKLAAFQFAEFEIAGVFGGILIGFLSDKFRKNKRSFLGLLFTLLMSVSLFYMYSFTNSTFVFRVSLVFSGFFVYAIQVLAGIIANDYSTRKTASATTGMLGFFAYIGSCISGVLVGFLVDNYGWDMVFVLIFISSLLCFIFFCVSHYISRYKEFFLEEK